MKLLISIVVLYLAYKYLDKDSLLRKIVMIWAGIVLALSALSLVFSIVSIFLYVCIAAMILMFVIGLLKKVFQQS